MHTFINLRWISVGLILDEKSQLSKKYESRNLQFMAFLTITGVIFIFKKGAVIQDFTLDIHLYTLVIINSLHSLR